MSKLLIFTLFQLLLISCEFSDSGVDSSGLFSGHKPATNNFELSVSAKSSNKENDSITVKLTHPVTQIITGTPRIALDIGGSTAYANYISGDGTRVLTFKYTVTAAQNDLDGIQVSSVLDLNGGTVKFSTLSGTLNSNTSLPSVNTSNIKVDTTAPTISVAIAPNDKTYTLGQKIQYAISFDENVIVTGVPSFSLNIGGTLRNLNYTTGSTSSTLLFQTTVIATDLDNDGAEGISPLLLNSGTIKDSAGNNAILTFNIVTVTPPVANINVNGSLTTIQNITLPVNNTYLTGASLNILVQFSDTVTVVGSPTMAMNLNSGTKSFVYSSGSGTNILTFAYIVDVLDNDNDGVEVVSPINLSGGAILDSSLIQTELTFAGPIASAIIINPIAATLTLDTFPAINILNTFTYSLTGTCSENGSDVNIDIGGLTDTYICTSNLYTFTIDASSLTDDPAIAINISHSVATAVNTTVLKDTVAPTATLNALADIVISNSTSYAFSGTCSEDTLDVTYTIGALTGSVVCTSSTFSFSGIDLTSEADSATFNISISHSDIALNPTTASLTAIKDTVAPTILITSSPAINNSNVASYQAVGTCSENGIAVAVNIGGITDSPVCTSSTWITAALDLTSLPDGTVTIVATHTKVNTNSNFDTIDISKSLTPTVTITSALDIDISNEASYEILGSCSENTQNVNLDIGGIAKIIVCTSGSWSSGSLDVSSLLDGVITITADHSTAPQATFDVNKDSSSEVVTITSSSDISVSNETSYTLSGTCTTNGSLVSVSIGGLAFSPTCTSSTWSTGVIDVSALADGSIIITADHTTAPQATTTIDKSTSTPTVSSLTSPSTLPNSINLSWTLNDPGGFTIDDYIINYRIKGATTWLPFSDGISVLTTSEVTALTPSTTYEFRINVQYDTSNNSPWSNTVEAETQPDSPLFGPNVAMNVGGATSSTVAAFEDVTNITLNGLALVTLNKGQTHTFTSAQFDVIDADKPIYTAGKFSSANIVWNPTSWAGKTFSFNSIRSNPQKLFIYATEGATVEVKQGATLLDSVSLAADSSATLSWSVYGSYQVVSTGAILAFHISNTTTDPKPLLPSSLEIIGFPSSSMRITTDLNSTNYTLRHSNSTLATGALSKVDSITVNPQGTSSLYQSESLLITADKKISGASFADSNGSCAAPFVPTNLMKTKHIINVPSDFVAFASKSAGTISVLDGLDNVITTLTLTRSGADSNAPYKTRIAVSAAGTRFISTIPVAGWYQPSTNTGGAAQDETVLHGTD